MAQAQQILETPADEAQRFYAHAREEGRHCNHLVPGASSPQDAAMIFAEHWASADPARQVSVIVENAHTGEQQCFMIDIDSGDAEPCT